jgi:hypothetical protein
VDITSSEKGCRLTCRLSQDALESAFSKIRSLGMCYVQPSATEFDYRVRLLSVLHLSEAGVGGDFARPIVNLINYCKNNATVSDLKCSRPCEKCNEVQTSAASTPLSEIPLEPLRYVAGYVAYRLSATNPELGSKASPLEPLRNPPSWIDILNKGGLTAPSDEFFGTVVKLEQCFLHYYGQAGVHTCLNVVSKLAALMRSSVDCSAIPSKAVDVYAKLRVIIRMRNEGLCYDAQKVARSNSRKLRKFTN